MARVVVVGSINQDIVVSLDSAPRAGETVHGDTLNLFPGGKGANQAVAASLAGATTLLFGRVGNDAFGTSQRNHLDQLGVDLNIETDSKLPTGTAVIFVENSGENRIALVSGANSNFLTDHVPDTTDLKTDDIVLVQNEISTEATRETLARAKSAGATTVFNVAPAMKLDTNLKNTTDILVVNEIEFEEITGRVLPIDDLTAAAGILTEVASEYDRGIVATIGAKGILAHIDNQPCHVAGLSVAVKDTTGAGDCFLGNFAAALSKNLTINDSLELANRAAAWSVQHLGASTSFPTQADLAA